MAHEEEKLPWDMMEEILSRVPPKSLVRFRSVRKQWNNLFNDKRFIKNHKTTFHFVLTTKSKFYSVNVINPKILDVRELTLDIPRVDESQIPENFVDCNEFLLCSINDRAVVWNPWLRHSSTWVESGLNKYSVRFSGVGYDNNRSYKIIGSCRRNQEDPTKRLWKIYDFASDEWRDYDSGTVDSSTAEGQKRIYTLINTSVSLNGTMYWVSSSDKIDDDCLFIQRFDFSKEKFFVFCDIPCGKINHDRDAVVLGIYKGDRFSLLKQCYATKKIEILLTKDKIISDCDSQDVVWMKFMQVSIPNFLDLVDIKSYSQPSYFIDNDKRLVVCSCDESGRAWIYVVWENKLISKIQIDSVVDIWPLHCTYNPSLFMAPSVQRQEV